MFTKSTLISVGSVIVNLGIALVICYKLGFLAKDEVSVVTDIAGPIITIIAIVLAYVTFENQRETNQKNLSSLVLNQIIGEINEIRSALDLVSIKVDQSTTLMPSIPDIEFESGSKAVLLFLKVYQAGSIGTPISPFRYSKLFEHGSDPAIYFTTDVLTQLGSIVRVSKKISDQQLTEDDRRRAKIWLGSLIESYLGYFDLIFERIFESLMVIGADKYRVTTMPNFPKIMFFNEAFKKRNNLISDLVDNQFIERDAILKYDFSDANDEWLTNRQDYLEENFDNLTYLKYKVKS